MEVTYLWAPLDDGELSPQVLGALLFAASAPRGDARYAAGLLAQGVPGVPQDPLDPRPH